MSNKIIDNMKRQMQPSDDFIENIKKAVKNDIEFNLPTIRQKQIASNKLLFFSTFVLISIISIFLIYYFAIYNSVSEINMEANFMIYKTVDDLDNASELIITGSPLEDFTHREHIVKYDSEGGITDYYTLTNIKIEKIFKKPINLNIEVGQIIQIIEPIGFIQQITGKIKMKLDGYDEMVKNNKYVIFLKKGSGIIFSVINMNSGKFNLTNDNAEQIINRDDVMSKYIIDNNEIEEPTKEAVNILKNIKVIADDVNIRQDKSTASKIVGKISTAGKIIEILDESADKDGKIWYQVYADFGVKGWIAGWLCEKTSESPYNIIRSKPGELLDNVIDKNLFVKLMTMENYTEAALITNFGKDFIKTESESGTKYDYANGLYFSISEKGDVYQIGIDTLKISTDSIRKKTCDIFQSPGNEILIFYINQNIRASHYELLVVNFTTKVVLRNYGLDFLSVENFEVGDFLNNGTLQLYLEEYDSDKSCIYSVQDNDFVKVYNTDAFALYTDGIKAVITANELSVNINVGGYSKKFISILPERIFYNNKDIKDKNSLLSIDQKWNVEKTGDKWSFRIHNAVNFSYGIPAEQVKINYDLARVDMLIEIHYGQPKIMKTSSLIKYDNPNLLKINPINAAEGKLLNGPALGMKMEDAYKALCGDMKNFVNSDEIKYNGVTLFGYDELSMISVTNPKYSTTRGLKVGDSIEKVESLYGKPDEGFPVDGFVKYYTLEEWDGKLRVTWGRSLNIYYKDGIVVSYDLYQFVGDI